METLKMLPDVSGRRFGSMQVGYDKVDTIRVEMLALLAVVVALLGVEAQAVTMAQIRAVHEALAKANGKTRLMDVRRVVLGAVVDAAKD